MRFPTTRAPLGKYRDLLKVYIPLGGEMVSFFKGAVPVLPPKKTDFADSWMIKFVGFTSSFFMNDMFSF